MPTRRLFAAVVLAVAAAPAAADGPKDNQAGSVRPIPPKGVTVPAADKADLTAGLADLRTAIDTLPGELKGKADLLDLLPDVEIFHKAVRYAVEYDEFFDAKDIPTARKLLKQGTERAKELAAGRPSWPTATGLVVRGYRSKIDGSVQPYGLVVPKSFGADVARNHRLDLWWHGRMEFLSEVYFLNWRQTNPGDFTPPDAFVLHPYGRYCNAAKFAGEVDTFEAMDHVKKHYPIDADRIAARGFSMGGAACWQFATHYPTVWAAAAPGAGFAETPEFLNVFQNEKVKPEWWEERLWHWYNATDYAQNIFDVPTVAYSGEIDKQKQAADVMAREMKKVGLELTHVIGPKTAHSYEKEAKKEVAQRIDAIVAKGRPASPRAEIKFVTYTLRYNVCDWLEVRGLKRHWQRSEVDGRYADGRYDLTTKGVTALAVTVAPGPGKSVVVDGQTVFTGGRAGATSVQARITDGKWGAVAAPAGPVKKPGLQGPLDDAFLDSFFVYGPSGKAANEPVGTWVDAELKHFVTAWRRQFRGDLTVHPGDSFAWEDVENGNLILWGDPSSNKVLAEVVKKLPLKWTADVIEFGGKTYDAKTHIPVLIFPNPLNPAKYVVLNSGFTYREYDYLNNARQTPKLPDYAIVDVTTPPNARWPGKVVRAGFFGEKWELLPDDGK